jgi:hypothetical protein
MSSSAGRNRSFRRSSRGFAIASPTLMTRHRIAQSGENWNPKSPENRPEPAVSCKNDYSDPAARPPCSTAWRFFTGDYRAVRIRSLLQCTAFGHPIIGLKAECFANRRQR